MAKTKNDNKANGLLGQFDTDIIKNTEKQLFGAAHMQGMMLRSLLQYNLEAARFLQHRLEEDLKTAEAFSSCTNFSELNDAGEKFCKRALEEYGEEAAKLTNLGVGLMSKAAEDVQQEAVKVTAQ